MSVCLFGFERFFVNFIVRLYIGPIAMGLRLKPHDIDYMKMSTHVRLTTRIFKTFEPICVIFGTHLQKFILNTSVNSILNTFLK